MTGGCGKNTTITGQNAEDTVTVQETETKKTTETAEETENYENYEELVSVPVDGRDGSQEKPYQVGDEIYFPSLTNKELKDNLHKLQKELDSQIGDNYMKRSKFYVRVCIVALFLSVVGLIGVNAEV